MLPKFLRCYVIFNYSYRFVKREGKKSIKKKNIKKQKTCFVRCLSRSIESIIVCSSINVGTKILPS